MKIPFTLQESLQSISSNPLRSGLSIIGVVFGVASVVTMLSIGLGAEAEIQRLLDALGARNIHITAKQLEESDWNRVLRLTVGLSMRDLHSVKNLFAADQPVELAWVESWRADDASLPLPGAKLDVYGVTPNYRQVLGIKLRSGRSFSPREDHLGRPVCVLGEDLASTWYGSPEKAIGSMIRIERAWFTVIGVLAGRTPTGKINAAPSSGNGEQKSHQSSDPITEESANNTKTEATSGAPGLSGSATQGTQLSLLDFDDSIVMPQRTAEQRLGIQSALAPMERIIVKLSPQLDAIKSRASIAQTLDSLHRGAKVVDVTAAEEVIEQKRSTTRLFSYFLITIAMISLIVGGIGIANVMLAGMVERIREVGLRRAIGAKKRHILWQFLSEALAICILGGLLGGFVGMAGSLLIAQMTGWNVAFPWWGHAVAVTIATLVGIASGLYPAILASKISPIEALQGRA